MHLLEIISYRRLHDVDYVLYNDITDKNPKNNVGNDQGLYHKVLEPSVQALIFAERKLWNKRVLMKPQLYGRKEHILYIIHRIFKVLTLYLNIWIRFASAPRQSGWLLKLHFILGN